MRNLETIYGIKCPACGNVDELIVSVSTNAKLTGDGANIIQDHYPEWDFGSWATCKKCGYEEQLHYFHINEEPEKGVILP